MGNRAHGARPADLDLAGPHLAAQAIKAGLVDEYQLYVAPAIVGGGTSFFPEDVSVELELLVQQKLGNGVVYLAYRAVHQ